MYSRSLIILSVLYSVNAAITAAPFVAVIGGSSGGACPTNNLNNVAATFGSVTRNSVGPSDCYQFCRLSPQTQTYPWYFGESFIGGDPVQGMSICSCYTAAYASSGVDATNCLAGYGINGNSEFVWIVNGP
jgi:hypothetical protein